MCFADGSLAPAAPNAGSAGEQRTLMLTATDGNVLMAHECRADSNVGIVVLPDIRGLHTYYRDLTVRLSEAGYNALAIDYFGRTAAGDDRSDAFDWQTHIPQTTPEGVAADVAAGVEHLRGLGIEKVFTLGFCFGGGYSWRQSADTPGLAGCIGFYGRSVQPLAVIDDMTAPLLMLVAGADANIPVEDPKQVAGQAKVEVDFVVFDGCPHSFFDRAAPQHADACVHAWERITGFIAAHS